ncbi:MAG: amino acid adenylation domain-containing protein [Ardenticatenaceae bacterium]|nr:amino acid adenylation domain-containing protein [Ardenticatenaceae bacterium]MCB9442817.1 amino acid adenylation domain-containing protein [Ardenticatenaceae bacterium]
MDNANLQPVDFDPFAEGNILLTAPITEAQKEIWLSAQMGDGANCAFNESMSLRLRGDLNKEALETAVAHLIQRHEALRITFSTDGQTLLIEDETAVTIPIIDLSAQSANERSKALANLIDAEVTTPFDLANGPLLRVKIVKLSQTEHEILFTIHHIVGDGWSIAMLLSDLGHLYDDARRGVTADLPPAYKYSAYARHVETQKATGGEKTAEAYWLKQFSGSIPLMDLPTDRPRPKFRTYNAAREDVLIEPQLVKDLKRLGARAGCTFFNTMFATFNIYLSKLLGQDDLAVGVPAAGQSVVGEENLIGHCINMLPIRTKVDNNLTITDYFKHMKGVVLNAYDHQEYTFGTLLEKLALPRDASRIPLIPITFNIDQEPRDPFYGDLQASYFCNPRRYENFEMAVNCFDSPKGLTIEMQYNTDLFDRATILQRVAEFKALMANMVAKPDSRLHELSIIPEDMRRTLLKTWNATQMNYPQNACVHELISERAAQHSDRTAVIAGDVTMTYGELDGRSNQLARHLQSLGVGPDALVAVSLERTVDMLVGVLGVWKAGGAYVPLDPAYPTERLALMLEDSQAAILLTESELLPQLPPHNGTTVILDAQWPQIKALNSEPVATAVKPEHLAYVIYTSGSTGRPKGVQVPHGAAVNFLVSMAQTPGFSADDTLLAVTTLSFDIHVLELYLPLLQNGRIILASRGEAADGEQLLRLIRQHNVTVMQATPTSWRLLIAAGWNKQDALKVLIGGEALPPDLARELLERSNQVWNMYGPTETTVWSTCYRVTDPDAPILIGRPIGNTTVYVLDAQQQPVPVGVPGELYIGGAGVTRGYLHRPELTEERFLPDRFSDLPGDLLYRTGDLVRFRPDGNLEYFRRLDNQVKVRGFRIELGDIEAAMEQFPDVYQAVTAVRDDMPGGKALVGYILLQPEKDGQQEITATLRRHLREKLPDYMVPSHFVVMDEFPLTPNGKIDRRALPKPVQTDGGSNETYVAPRNELETAVAQIWSSVLNLSKVGMQDDFFDLGGHSLLAIQIVTRINQSLGVNLPLGSLFQMPTIADLAQSIAAQKYVTESTTLLETADPDDQEEFVF